MTTVRYPEIPAGNTIRSTVVFTPASGVVSSAAYTSCRHVCLTTLEWVDVSTDIVKDSDNNFHVDFDIDDEAIGGVYQVRWESNTPAPHISYEDETTKFVIIQSNIPDA